MGNLDISKSILNELDNQDIQEIYFDYLRTKDGYTRNYVLDADELREYCLPFHRNINKDLGEVADEQFLIRHLFESSETKIIILQDYFEELFALHDYIMGTLNVQLSKKALQNYIVTLQEFLEKLKNNKDDTKSYLREVLKSYSFLLSISDGNYKIILSSLNTLVSKATIIEGIKNDSNISKYLSKYTPNKELIDRLYDTFEIKGTSKYYDINAILKTYHLTNSSFNDEKKQLFYFLSSSTNDIKLLRKKIIENKFNEVNEFCLGTLENGEYSLIRSKSQVFALLIYSTWDNKIKDNKSKPLLYDEFKAQIMQLIKKWDQKGTSHQDFVDKLKLERSKTIEIKENLTIHLNRKNEISGLGEIHTLKVNNFEKLLKQGGLYDKEIEQEIKQIIDRSKEVLSSEFGETNLLVLSETLNNYMKLSQFENEVIETFLEGLRGTTLEFDRGEDPIESIFNAFPALFEYPFYKDILFPILEKIEKEEVSSEKIIEAISGENIHSDLYMFIMYLFLLIKYKHQRGNYSSDFLAYKNVEVLIRNKLDSLENSQTLIGIDERKYLKDLYALGCWASRRARCYRFSYELSIEALKKYPNDPRFSHSLALVGYCWKYEYDTTGQYDWPYSNSEKIITKNYFSNEGKGSVIGYCRDSINKYLELGVLENIRYKHLINNYVALLNLTAYVFVIKYKLLLEEIKNGKNDDTFIHRSDDHIYLMESRKYIEEMKSILKVGNDNDQKWKNYPAYLHTEVFLEYYELRDQIEIQGIKNNFQTKLASSINDINYAIKKSNKRPRINEKCKKLKKRLLGLDI